MIPCSQPLVHPSCRTDDIPPLTVELRTLRQQLGLHLDNIEGMQEVLEDFSFKAPLSYLKKIHENDATDPLLLQILPSTQELEQVNGYSDDPVGDQSASLIPGLIQKYQGRALIMVTSACAIHCRYCFRRHHPAKASTLTQVQWQAILDYLASSPDIQEVILSGGDPLTLSNRRLEGILANITAIPHIKRIRIHTRVPTVQPERIDQSLHTLFSRYQNALVMVLHINHPRELDHSNIPVLQSLNHAGITLFNQSVLLKNINDSAETLCALSEQLFTAKVIPYYLHLLDKVRGAHHFSIDQKSAITLHHQLRCRLPGYLVPRLVTEQTGHPAKIPVVG